jgi:hypothetical protein
MTPNLLPWTGLLSSDKLGYNLCAKVLADCSEFLLKGDYRSIVEGISADLLILPKLLAPSKFSDQPNIVSQTNMISSLSYLKGLAFFRLGDAKQANLCWELVLETNRVQGTTYLQNQIPLHEC